MGRFAAPQVIPRPVSSVMMATAMPVPGAMHVVMAWHHVIMPAVRHYAWTMVVEMRGIVPNGTMRSIDRRAVPVATKTRGPKTGSAGNAQAQTTMIAPAVAVMATVAVPTAPLGARFGGSKRYRGQRNRRDN